MKWKPIETAPEPEKKQPSEDGPFVLFALPDGRVKEGRIRLVYDFNDMENLEAYRVSYWLANDSRSCCYSELPDDEKPTHWAEMPKHPTREPAHKEGE